jgi:hypothetical protein
MVMALKVSEWNKLSTKEKTDVANFLRGNCKIDREHPSSSNPSPNSYPITDGITSGGYPMKFGEEYRIYVINISGIPAFLDAELKERGTRNRIGGSETILAIMEFGGFHVGYN